MAGGPLTILWTVANTGSGTASGPWTDRIVVVNTATGTTLLDTTATGTGPLAAGASHSRSHAFTLPAGATGAGLLRITVTTDSGNAVAEANTGGTAEANNARELMRAAATLGTLTPTSVAPAGSLVSAARTTGAIAFAEDFDVWALPLPAGRTAAVGIAPSDPGLRLRVLLIDPDGATVGEATAAAAGARVRLDPLAITVAGTYRVVVAALSGTGGFGVVAAVDAAIEADAAGGGSNDTLVSAESLVAAARPLVGSADRLAALGTADGAAPDLFSFGLTVGREAAVVVTPLEGGDVGVELLDAAGVVVAVGVPGATNSGPAIRGFVATTPGPYYVRVRGTAGATYSLLVTRAAGFEREPNDAPSAATPLGASGVVLGHIALSSGGGSAPTGPGTAITLPLELFDANGFRWDIQTDGSVSDGTSDAYDGGLRVSGFPAGATATIAAGGREVSLGPATVGGVVVSRRIFVPADQGWARYLEVVTNPGTSPVSFTVQIDSNLGSDGGTRLIGVSSGASTFGATDDWIVTDDGPGGDPAMLHVVAGPGAAIRPSSAGLSGDSLTYGFPLTLAPGQTRIVMHFAAQNVDQPTALAKGPLLAALPSAALAGLSSTDLEAIVNFVVGDSDSYAVPAQAGVPLVLTTATPGGAANTLVPTLELLDPSGLVVATNSGGASDGRNALVSHTPAASGRYVARVKGGQTGGDYVLTVTGAVAAPGPRVTAVSPAVGPR
ncbi:MAG: CARDB domain-containing protein [Planctomycetaceae bacterium]